MGQLLQPIFFDEYFVIVFKQRATDICKKNSQVEMGIQRLSLYIIKQTTCWSRDEFVVDLYQKFTGKTR